MRNSGEPPADASEWTTEQWKAYLKQEGVEIQFRPERPTKPFRVQVRLPKAVQAQVRGNKRRGQSWSTFAEAKADHEELYRRFNIIAERKKERQARRATFRAATHPG